jgi:hypothetical protein
MVQLTSLLFVGSGIARKQSQKGTHRLATRQEEQCVQKGDFSITH